MPTVPLPVSLFGAPTDNAPSRADLSWPDDFSHFIVATDKKEVPLWSPALYPAGATRGNTSVESVSALALDLDDNPDLGTLFEVWKGYEHVVYSTYGHTPQHIKVRLVLPYPEPIDPKVAGRLWLWGAGKCEAAGLHVDPSTKDASRLHFWPSHPPEVTEDETAYWFNDAPVRVGPAALGSVSVREVPGQQGSAPGASSSREGTLLAAAWDRPVTQLEDAARIEARCNFLANARDNAAVLSEPLWYGALSIWGRCKNGDELAHERSKPYPRYTFEETEEKLQRAKSVGPMTCARARDLGGKDGPCKGCPLNVTSPILLGGPDPSDAPTDMVDRQAVVEALAAEAGSWVDAVDAKLEAARRQVEAAKVAHGVARQALTKARAYESEESVRDRLVALSLAETALSVAKNNLKATEKEHKAAKKRAAASNGNATGADILVVAALAINPDTGLPRASLGNVRLVLENDPKYQGNIRLNEFNRRPYYFDVQAIDTADTDIATDIEYRYGFEVSTLKANEAAAVVAAGSRFHPVRDYLTRVAWDGVPRVSTLLDRGFGALGDPEMLAMFATKFMVSCVARVFQPGCDSDTMLVLVGRQGAGKNNTRGKSKGLRALISPDEALKFGPWFFDSKLDLLTKDGYQVLQGRWLVEVSELDSFRRVENTTIKAFLSSSVDTYRPSHGRHVIEAPRQCVIVGTTNEPEFLTDSTGSRRYMPVKIDEEGGVDADWIEANRDQLWAEAKALYDGGTTWSFIGEEATDLAAAAEEFQSVDPWTEPIVDYLRKRRDQRTTTTVFELLTLALGISNAAQVELRHKQRIGAILNNLKFPRHRIMEGGVREYIYDVPEAVTVRGKVVRVAT